MVQCYAQYMYVHIALALSVILIACAFAVLLVVRGLLQRER